MAAPGLLGYPAPGPVTIPLAHLAADDNWGGNGPRITVTTATTVTPNQITVAVTATPAETAGDHSAAGVTTYPVVTYLPPAP